MRVIAGQYRSRVLTAPRGDGTRPTSDRLRETLFNVLTANVDAPRIAGARFVDLYAGSGAVGIEALSRGAAFCWFAENARPAVAAIRANVAALKLQGGYAIEDRSVTKLLHALTKEERRADIVFLDPPYDAAEEYAATMEFLAQHAATALADDAIVIAEHARKQPLAEVYGVLRRTRVLEQGDAALSFYELG